MSFSSDLVRGFKETLSAVGTAITFNGVTKQCVTGAIELERIPELSGDLPNYGTQATMLTSDFTALGCAVRSRVTVAGVRMIILKIDKDPVDPLTDFVLINEK
jgi:hypothetical protein